MHMDPQALFGGLDLSYTGTACVIVDVNGDLVAKKALVTQPKDYPDAPERLVKLRDGVVNFFDEYGVSLICIEWYSHGSKWGRESAGELGGVVRVALYEAGYAYQNVAIPALKTFICDRGNAKKNLMMREVYKRWRYEADDDNDGDAFALAQLSLEMSTDPKYWTKKFAARMAKLTLQRVNPKR